MRVPSGRRHRSKWGWVASAIHGTVRPKAGEPRSGCAINAAVEVIGDRWSLLVLRDIMFGNRRHFRVLQKQSEERIASNILADRSRRLVEDGLLTREVPAGVGARPIWTNCE